jgi:polysaccharide biosynthesis protein PslH
MESAHVVVLSPIPPDPADSGFAIRVSEPVTHLRRHHTVTVVTPADLPGGLPRLDRSTTKWAGATRRWMQARAVASNRPFATREAYLPELQARLDRVCSDADVDVVVVESAHMAEYRVPLGPVVVLDEHNLEYELSRRMAEAERSALRRAYHRREAAKLERVEQRLWHTVSGCALTSTREERVVRSIAPELVTAAVPNGVDCEYFTPATTPVVPHSLVFVGLLRYRPNLDGALHLVDDILPAVRLRHPDTTVTIVGDGDARDLARLRREGVDVTGRVADVRPYVARAEVVAVPIRIGSGTRLKVVEGLAMGKPMVSTALGYEGLDLVPGRHLLAADGARAFGDAVARLFEDRLLACSLGREGRAEIERSHTWEQSSKRFRALIDECRARTLGGRTFGLG